MKRLIIFAALLAFEAVWADSTLSFDLPKDYLEKREKKKLLLTIKIPSELTSDEEVINKKRVDTSHVELDPFARNTKPVDFTRLRELSKKGLITGVSKGILEKRNLENKYEICNMLVGINDKFMRLDKEDVIEMGIAKEDIFFMEAMYNQFAEELKMYRHINFAPLIERFQLLKKQLRGGRGDIRVVEVQEEEDGSTILYLTLQEEK
ncbi:MAG: hypothetical protein PHQ23_11275 [Candidatus Wallbacteria bacterium]|nr:hypothetical protein [Candidatus Wallbacteria bacterium]